MIIVKYFINIVILIGLFGCGGNEKNNNKSKDLVVHTNDMSLLKTIDPQKAKEAIAKQLGDDFTNMVVSSNKKHIFVLINHKFQSVLLDYDITGTVPILRNKIAEFYDTNIIKVQSVKNTLIIFQEETPVELTYLHLYNYIEKREVAIYEIWGYEINSKLFEIDTEKKNIILDKYSINIESFYSTKTIINNSIYRDDQREVVVDTINHLVWRDDYTLSKYYSLEQAMNVCKPEDRSLPRPPYNWRLPTNEDIHKLIAIEKEPFDYTFFKKMTYGDNLLAMEKNDKHPIIYSIDHNGDNNYYIKFVMENSGYNALTYKVRCVADY